MQQLNDLFTCPTLSPFSFSPGNESMEPPSPWLCGLSDFDLLRVSGEDASTFLNAQLTNDFSEVSEEKSQFSAYCTPKGRTYCTFRTFRHNGDYYIRTTSGLSDKVLARLRMFVLRSRTSFDKDGALEGIALLGKGSEELLKKAGLSPPVTVSGSALHKNCRVILAPGVCKRYEIYAPRQDLEELSRLLSPDVNFTTDSVWRLYDILSGIPNIYIKNSELFVPQMINLDLIGAVNFSKGCYPGQEIVARVHYKGKTKRRMYRFVSRQNLEAIELGTALFVDSRDKDQPSGEVVDAYRLPDGTVHGLAVLRMEELDKDKTRLVTSNGDAVDIAPLPYKLSAETDDGQFS